MKALVLFALLIAANAIYAKDLGFRYQAGKCVDAQGREGLNPEFLGPCGDLGQTVMSRFDFSQSDLRGAVFDGSDLQESSFKGADLTGTSFRSSRLDGADLSAAIVHQTNFDQASLVNAHLTGADISGASFRRADLTGGLFSYLNFSGAAFEAAQFSEATLDHVDFRSSELNHVNFRGANLRAAKLDEATLDGADFEGGDLSHASLQNVRGTAGSWRKAVLRLANMTGAQLPQGNFQSARLEGAILTDADVTSGDFRGASLMAAQVQNSNFSRAIYSDRSVLPFSLEQARDFGMVFVKAARLLVIWDKDGESERNGEFPTIATVLKSQDIEVVFSRQIHSQFDGTQDLSEFSAILLVASRGYNQDIPLSGQQALVAFVNAGGTFIATQYTSYMLANGRLQGMKDLILLTYSSASTEPRSYNFSGAVNGDPLLLNVTPGTAVTCNHANTRLRTFNPIAARTLISDQRDNPLVVVRDVGAGHAINFAWVLNVGATPCIGSATTDQLLINAVSL